MSLKPVRNFFRDRILEIDKSFKDRKEAFTSDSSIQNLSANLADRSFHIFYADLSNGNVNQSTTEDPVQVRVELYFKSKGDPRADLDTYFDLANSIRLNAMDFKKLKLEPVIKSVVCTSVRPEPFDTNSKEIMIPMIFTVRVLFNRTSSLVI